jgi:hypothetical protein
LQLACRTARSSRAASRQRATSSVGPRPPPDETTRSPRTNSSYGQTNASMGRATGHKRRSVNYARGPVADPHDKAVMATELRATTGRGNTYRSDMDESCNLALRRDSTAPSAAA